MKKRYLLASLLAGLCLLAVIFTSQSVEAAEGDTATIYIHKRIFRDVTILDRDPSEYEYQNDGREIKSEDWQDKELPEIVTGATSLNGAQFTVYDATEYFYKNAKSTPQEFVETVTKLTNVAAKTWVKNKNITEVGHLATKDMLINGVVNRGAAQIDLAIKDDKERYKVYLIIEDGVDDPASLNVDMLHESRPLALMFPVTDPVNSGDTLKEIHLYPKNLGYLRDPYFFKMGKTRNGNDDPIPLEGAKFVMYQEKDGKKLYLDMSPTSDLRNKWQESSDPLNDEKITKFTSDKDGLVATVGRLFPAGTYYFEEVQGVEGYDIDTESKRVEVIIPDTWEDGEGNFRYVTIDGQAMEELYSGQIPDSAYETQNPRIYNFRSGSRKTGNPTSNASKEQPEPLANDIDGNDPPSTKGNGTHSKGFLPRTNEGKTAISIVGLLIAGVAWYQLRKKEDKK